MEKKKEEKKSQAKYRKEEKGKTYIKKHNKAVERKQKEKRKKEKIKHLNACTNMEAIEEGKHAHEQIIESEWDLDAFVGRSLVDMYTKCGRMEDV